MIRVRRPCSRNHQADDVETIIYTSGTTGTPKGAMLTHGNLTSNFQCSVQGEEIGPTDSYISFLPLSHVTARHVDYPMLHRGVTVAYLSNHHQSSDDPASKSAPPYSSASPASTKKSATSRRTRLPLD